MDVLSEREKERFTEKASFKSQETFPDRISSLRARVGEDHHADSSLKTLGRTGSRVSSV